MLDIFLKDPYKFIENCKLSDITKLISNANDKYYNTSKQIMSDQQYDLLVDELRKRKPQHKLLKSIGSNVHSKNKIKLPYYMGSMDKIKPGKNLVLKWKKKFNGPYIYSDKLDGTSALLILPNNKLYTRGNGTTGTDISSILKFISKIPNYEKKNKIVVRGELIISKKKFLEFKKKYKNSRSMVNGLINKKNITKDELKNINFVAYELVHPNYNISNQFKILNELKFETVFNKKISDLNEENLSSILKKRKSKSKYDIDGIIISDDNKHIRNTSGNPKYSFAFKDLLEEQIKNTTVIKVEWNVSKDGRIKPKVHVKAIEIGGITIRYCTGHNAKFIKNNGIGKGAIIKLIRSGDVIPYILSVIKKSEPDFPNINYIWDSNKIDILVNKNKMSKNTENELLIKNITFFIKKLNIKNIDISIVKKLIEAKLDTIPKILSATKKDLLLVDGFKEIMANKIYNNIRNSTKSVNLSKLMYASNIFGSGLGDKKLSIICNNYPNILLIKDNKKLENMILNLDGFSNKTTNEFIKSLPKFKKFLKTLPKFNIVKSNLLKKKIDKRVNNKTLVFSGFRNSEYEKIIESKGGKVVATISKNTNILVVKDINKNTSKIKKAKELNIKIISLDNLKEILN